MSGRTIDSMIAEVRDKAQARKRQHQEGLEQRRTRALRRIGQAVIDHDLPIANSVEVDDMLASRLQKAQRVRISEAEAMADMAEFDGDISSRLHWWEIFTKEGTILWKGYTRHPRLARVYSLVSFDGKFLVKDRNNVSQTPLYIDIRVRRACYGAIIASLYVGGEGVTDGEGVESVGISEGLDASVKDAVVSAYVAYFSGVQGYAFEREDIPTELLKKIDSNTRMDVELTNSRSVENATNPRRESEEQGE